MAFCSRCGSAVNDGAAFCPQCGAAVGVVPGAPPPVYPPYVGAPVTSGMQENVAGLLCYLGWWLTGVIFLIIDKRPVVRFHAAQSIVVFGALTVIRIVLGAVFAGSWYYGVGTLYLLIFGLFNLVCFAAWILLMIMAYQGKRYEIPIVSGIARSLAGKI